IEEKEEISQPLPAYGDYVRVLQGRHYGTVCLPLASSADVPCPSSRIGSEAVPCQGVGGPTSAATNLKIADPAYESAFGLSHGLNCEFIPPEEIQDLWNQVLAESNRQVSQQTAEEAKKTDAEKTKKLEMLLRLALNGGDIDTAMLLFSGLESKESNQLAAN